jgi:hypothetical protein
LNNYTIGNHFKIRIRAFTIWINSTFSSTDAISIYVDGGVQGLNNYGNISNINDSCNGIMQKSSIIDTNDINHFNNNLTVKIGCNATTGTLIWGFK